MVDFIVKQDYTCSDLEKLVSFLRSDNGCPWDKEQTHTSIRRNLLEEAYEVCEGIDRDDADMMKEELGDVLLQVFFHADIERQRGRFTLDDVVTTVCRKLVFRHPHLFSDCRPEDWDWEEMKRREKGAKTQSEILEGVCRALPALIRAEKLTEKTGKVGCSWSSSQAAVDTAIAFLTAYREAPDEAALGKALLALTGAAVSNGMDAETALQNAGSELISRFREEEQRASAQHRELCSLDDLIG